MSDLTPHELADQITRQLDQLTDLLTQLPAHQATALIARILTPETGLFDQTTRLVAAGSRFAKDQAERGTLPADVWLALGRAANELDAVAADLDEYRETLRRVARQPANPAPKPSSPAALVVRRRR
jgi:ABC-type transporter Mla subunit MlaD